MMEEHCPTVLIIDDDSVARLLAREALEQSGWLVEEAEHGRRGLEVFVRTRPDLVLLDIMMPEMDGFAVCAELRRLPEGMHTPVLIMTGLEDYQSVTQAYDAGATDFIVKPINGLLLKHRVRYMLRAGQAMQELRDSQDKLVQARDGALEGARLKSEFLATISHEIRTPMNGIIGMDELLLETELTPEQRDCAETIRLSAKALLEIVNDILDFSKLESGRVMLIREEFVLSAVINENLALFQERSEEKGLLLRHEIASTVPMKLWGDPVRIGRLLSVLLSNAVKFTERGEVWLRVQLVAPSSGELSSGLQPGASRIRFLVSDTGIGISKSAAYRLFQPFVQADGSDRRRYGGTGLGLALAKQLVELMGGTLEFESEPGKGSQFWFDLSLARASDSRKPAFEPGNALVMMKDVVSQTVLVRTLEKLGCRVQTVISVEELRSLRPIPTPLLLFADFDRVVDETERMNVLQLKERLPSLHIVALGRGLSDSDLPANRTCHIDGYLDGPLTVEAIKSVTASWVPEVLSR
ncbi:MAG: response regulator [Nitrospira sp.]|jgi:signal transduction histidine kinase|nr:ATP-binding protein [Nitrospira sp. BO4]